MSVGDSVKPIVFVMEHGSGAELTGFPGGFQLKTKGDTVTVIGLIEESAKGLYNVQLSVSGVNNNASAKATIDVAPGVMTFELVEGSDNQSVVAGQDIVPIVYQYNHVKKIDGKGIPANLKVEQDKEKKQVKISGAVDSKSATHEYTYSFELTDYYDETMTVTGKVNVVAKGQSSSSVASSSSAESSSSEEPKQSSSSEVIKPETSSSAESSSSEEPKQSSSSEAASSSSEVVKPETSSSAESSSSEEPKPETSSSTESSSSTVESSSSTVEEPESSSSEKSPESSSSEESPETSSSEHTTAIVAAKPSFKFGYANNELTVVLLNSATVRVHVFDLMGHLVESFSGSATTSQNFNLAHLNMGNYVVRIESARYARTAKILVK